MCTAPSTIRTGSSEASCSLSLYYRKTTVNKPPVKRGPSRGQPSPRRSVRGSAAGWLRPTPRGGSPSCGQRALRVSRPRCRLAARPSRRPSWPPAPRSGASKGAASKSCVAGIEGVAWVAARPGHTMFPALSLAVTSGAYPYGADYGTVPSPGRIPWASCIEDHLHTHTWL